MRTSVGMRRAVFLVWAAVGVSACLSDADVDESASEHADEIRKGTFVDQAQAQQLGIADIAMTWKNGPHVRGFAGTKHGSGTIFAREFLLTARHNIWLDAPLPPKALPSADQSVLDGKHGIAHTLTVRVGTWTES